ncbi:hypothetical protein [uncultured Victivallis sp.]|uniref:hypothetical protein n=1 Tax=uncultured Victivallis sp. TaxID=354118 RepID=UPI0025F52BBF|nr:hypothetical protein [uncultured Victivallis sp.]
MMKQTTLLFGAFAFASALFFFSASAADTEAAPTPPENRQRDDGQSGGRRSGRPGGWNREGRRGGMMGAPVNPRAEAEAKIKEKFPEEFAAIEKMRAEAEAKLQELAKKAGVEIPKTMSEQLAELKAKYPKEMAEIEELGKTDRRAAFQKIRELAEKAGIKLSMPGMGGRPGMPGRGNGSDDAPSPPPRENPMRQLRLLRQKFPEEMAEVDRLRRSDPAAARAKTRELLKKLEAEQPAEKP